MPPDVRRSKRKSFHARLFKLLNEAGPAPKVAEFRPFRVVGRSFRPAIQSFRVVGRSFQMARQTGRQAGMSCRAAGTTSRGVGLSCAAAGMTSRPARQTCRPPGRFGRPVGMDEKTAPNAGIDAEPAITHARIRIC